MRVAPLGIVLLMSFMRGCHGNPAVPRAPTPAVIRQLPPERIYAALATGTMRAQASDLSEHDKRMMATFLSARPPGSDRAGDAAAMRHRCPRNPALQDPAAGAQWNGWGAGPGNARFQSAAAAGLTPAQVPRLHLKWAFGYPGGLSALGQPAVVSGRVFVGSDIGYVYALDAHSGCVYWSFEAHGSVRTAVSVGAVSGIPGTRYAAYFGDAHANAYALDAQSGKLLWMQQIDPNFTARITGAPSLRDGRLYVPLSSSEEFAGASLDYGCCTSRGAVAALDAATGAVLWKKYVVDPPRPTRRNSRGVQQYAPSGGSVWDSPTLDPVRGVLYVGTGDAQSLPAPSTTDAVLAMQLDTGQVRWSLQTRAADAWLGGCQGSAHSDNCPQVLGPDWDIGNSPILLPRPGGGRLLLVGTKDARVIALDPDRTGAVLWTTHVRRTAPPTFAADYGPGILWGGAADGERVYYGLRAGGVVALELASGRQVWLSGLGGAGTSNEAAVSAMPGVVFAGGSDGTVRALASADGRVLWTFATARAFKTVNGVSAHGGAIGAAGPVVAGGMLFVGSGYGVTSEAPGNVLLAFAVR